MTPVILKIAAAMVTATILAGAGTIIYNGNRLTKLETEITHIRSSLEKIERKIDRGFARTSGGYDYDLEYDIKGNAKP